MAGLLYYPLMNPPRRILYQALLYWDQLATIVPPEYEGFLTPQMSAVNDAGLYRPVLGQGVFRSRSLMLDGLGALTQLVRDVQVDVPLVSEPSMEPVHIARGKFDPEVEAALLSLGLATLDPDHDFYYRVPPEVAYLLLSTVAREIADMAYRNSGHLSRDALVAHTDLTYAHRAAHQPLAHSDSRMRGMRMDHAPVPCLQLEVSNLLPVPDDDVMVSDLLTFREKYDSERRNFMLELDRFVHDLQHHYMHTQDVLHLAGSRLAEVRTDYEKAAAASKLRLVARPIWIFVAFAGALASGQWPSWTWLSGTVGGYAINMATSEMRRPFSGDQNSYSYLHRVHQLLGT